MALLASAGRAMQLSMRGTQGSMSRLPCSLKHELMAVYAAFLTCSNSRATREDSIRDLVVNATFLACINSEAKRMESWVMAVYTAFLTCSESMATLHGIARGTAVCAAFYDESMQRRFLNEVTCLLGFCECGITVCGKNPMPKKNNGTLPTKRQGQESDSDMTTLYSFAHTYV
eukprot:1161835-Pelagomonas_calceolata.AAC.16